MNDNQLLLTSDILAAETIPAGYDNYADEILVANGRPPGWLVRLPYLAIVLALAYYLYVRAFDFVNLVFAALFVIWLIYTPIARKRGWFFIPM
ncbi:MAG: hypothetical protein L0332_25940 [Chloroflexi bacterium]|nr:hypothetical protein [Chloroflexota bacterium]MCI0575096.1 hypothetical protein [Chloroflexota bacterium]MCI0648202.1 hypothetical protein [Chloroflexota bacterium]MCI0730141.1 hypothetical protein [Chloroflexota bacterium]